MADKLTDSEIREQLIAFGEKNIGPITATTRALYIKKLNHYKARENSSSKTTGRRTISKKLLGFSSDESGDETGKASTSTRRRAGRGRGARAAPKPEPQPRAPIPTYDPPSQRRKSGGSSLRRRVLRNPTPEPVVEPEEESSQEEDYSYVATSPRGMTSFNMQTSMNTTYDVIDASGDQVDMDTSSRMPAHDEFDSTDPESDFDPTKPDEEENDSYDIGPSSSRGYSYTRTVPASKGKSTDSNNTHSRAVKSSSRGAIKTGSYQAKSSDRVSVEEAALLKSGFKTREDPASRCSQFISMLLLVLAAMFFVSLAFMYFMLPGSEVEDVGSEANFMLVPDSEGDKMEIGDAIRFEKEEIRLALPLVRDISQLLRKQAGLHKCEMTREGPDLKYDTLRDKLTELNKDYTWAGKFSRNMEVALVLIANNPQWKINLFGVDTKLNEQIVGASTKTIGPVLAPMYRLESETASTSLACRLWISINQVLTFLVLMLVVALLITVLISFWRWRKKRQEEEKRQIYDLVEKIINILKTHHDTCQASKDENVQPYLAIPMVRDQLIPAPERHSKQALWDKAVRFLSANESRVRQETQKIAGEEFMVWRWLQSYNTNGGKVWQGQACGEKDSSMVIPVKNYTQCLKVRNMFDPDIEYGEDWHIAIQDAILEKCGNNHRIVHIAVDKQSKEGCVYVKCEDEEAAGQAFRALQAWWFDGKLVTVKFLRLSRYHERFPAAYSCNAPLTPSNDRCRSLSQPFHRSIIESS